ncbi:hypothetical protein D9615_005356 [Tricholomella constricta]|uniref:N-acetyltransferase domain-containing protein n=1 Tax=Tricholomella constricta TaxID=117010 RepID=A0A8H5H6P9_9AGAR|nr:hypothetical protein D9615_005356 [Tricholomella constricta]
MAELDAQIRPLKASDDKLVRFTIGKASMESLAVANRRAYVHSLTMAAWLLLSYIIIGYLDLWPTYRYGIFGYSQPIPVLAASSVPIMILIDWLNRPGFEQLVQDLLRGPDMRDIHEYYSRSPASGFYICEFGGLFVGMIALDATPEPLLDTSSPASIDAKQKSPFKEASSTAIIRHLFVDEVYRSTGIQNDLLSHALGVAFEANPVLHVVKASYSPLIPYVYRCLRDASFVLEENTHKVGIFGWQLGMMGLMRSDWEKKNE